MAETVYSSSLCYGIEKELSSGIVVELYLNEVKIDNVILRNIFLNG